VRGTLDHSVRPYGNAGAGVADGLTSGAPLSLASREERAPMGDEHQAPISELLDEEEAAAYLKSTVGVLRKLRRTRGLRFVRVGNRIRYRIRDLDAFVERNIEQANDELIHNARRLVEEYRALGGERVIDDKAVLARIGACLPADKRNA
jgi:excisionase family DNA binding protein